MFLAKSNLRSSLASLESLDSFLIPAILSHSQIHSDILQSHWNEEIALLIHSIQNIIDTQAFCSCIIEIFDTSINNLSKSFDKDIVNNLLSHCDVLNQHLQINSNDLTLEAESSPRSLYYDNFLLMIKECTCALVLCKENEKNRIIKRMKILFSVLKKFHGTFKADEEPKIDKVPVSSSKLSSNISLVKTANMDVSGGEIVTSEFFFESMGITASPTKEVLYESKREKSIARRSSLQIVDSTFKVKQISDKDLSMSLTPSRRVKKSTFFLKKTFHWAYQFMLELFHLGSSLRRALFKRSKENDIKQLDDTFNNDTLGLHITGEFKL